MKTLKLLYLLPFIFLSCDKEDITCECRLKVAITNGSSISYYYVTGVKTDCNGNYTRPSFIPQEHFIMGLVDCE